jgi:hypothetical protein
MKGATGGLRLAVTLAGVTAGTTWLAMLSWRGFAVAWGGYMGPLLFLALIVTGLGVALRWSQLPGWAGILVEFAVVALLTWLMLGGSPFHLVASSRTLHDNFVAAYHSANTWAPPVPTNEPSITSLLLPPGALSLVVVDYLACWRRRVPLAGLPLLAIYSVPISLLGGGVPWLVFVLAAAGFLLMLFLQETEHITRWGRPLGTRGVEQDPNGFGVSNGASGASAGSVGIVAVVLAIILPIFIPTLHLGSLGLFGPGGSNGGVKIVNPITDMRRDLFQGKDVPLVDVTTDDPDPNYLRIAVLTQFNGVEWSAGDRSIISNQTADGLMPILERGLTAPIAHTYQYSATATSDFDSKWLPTEFPVSSITAAGNWHFDLSTMDFVAADSHTTTAGSSWQMTSAQPKLSAFDMAHSLTAPPDIQAAYTAFPSTLPPMVAQLAQQVTKDSPTRFEKMLALQDWFRSSGGFTYSLQNVPSGGGNDALTQFLSTGKGGRRGYCEQFASAFALMARTLEIPARVSIGFLQPDRVSPNHYVYSSHDLHAWPEVYFAGSGWVRFEPTPGQRAASVPAYTQGGIKKPQDPTATDSATRRAVPTETTASPKPDQTTGSTSSSHGTTVPWLAILVVLLVLAVLIALSFVPGAVRRARRRRRLAGRAEDVWEELRDSAVDLGVTWPPGRSPHETGLQLMSWFGPEPDGAPLVRPPRGRDLAPDAEDALGRIVLSVERVRYAREADDLPGALGADAARCLAALEHGATRPQLRRAHWLPRSVFMGTTRRTDAGSGDRQPEPVAAGNVVDHVG